MGWNVADGLRKQIDAKTASLREHIDDEAERIRDEARTAHEAIGQSIRRVEDTVIVTAEGRLAESIGLVRADVSALDTKVDNLKTEVSAVRESATATAVNVEWLKNVRDPVGRQKPDPGS